jgi:hypothetical protein
LVSNPNDAMELRSGIHQRCFIILAFFLNLEISFYCRLIKK